MSLASQEFSRILWTPTFRYLIHKIPPLFRIPRQINPVQIFRPIALQAINDAN